MTKKEDNILDLFEQSVEKKITKIKDQDLGSLSKDMNDMLEIGGLIGNAEESLKRLKKPSLSK